MTIKTFTKEEIKGQLIKDGKRDITDLELDAAIDILEHLGYLKRVSREIWSTTEKELP